MKISTSTDTVVERSGLGDDDTFGMVFNAKMAKILSDGLYSDKIKAIVRELSCNAVDSHVAAGKPGDPIEVHLPTVFEPFFHVKDFGTGLDHGEVMTVYTRYGASTKTTSDDFIGQLGLGSKAPFSYADAFDVTARKDGVERHYSMYKNEKGMPCVALLGTNTPTDRALARMDIHGPALPEDAEAEAREVKNGVTVSMPIANADFQRFYDKAAEVFMWFSVKPTILGIANLSVPDVSRLFAGDGWIVRPRAGGWNTHSSQAVALMGRVAYPINPGAIPNISSVQKTMLNMPLVLDFPIGALEVAASREALGYDKRTQDNIRDQLDKAIRELGEQLEERISTAETEWEARKRWSEMFGNYNTLAYELEKVYGSKGLRWKNKLIMAGYVGLRTADLWDEKSSSSIPIWSASGHRRLRQQRFHTTITISCGEKTAFVFDDLDKGTHSRVSHMMEQPGAPTTVYLIGHSDKKTREEIVDLLGNPPYVLASNLPRKPPKSRGTPVNMLEYKENGDDGKKGWKPTVVDLEAGGIYVMMDRYEVLDGDTVSAIALSSIVSDARQNLLLRGDQAIYSPRGHWRKKIEGNPKWINLWSHLRSATKRAISASLLQATADHREYQAGCQAIGDTAVWRRAWVLSHPNEPFGRMIAGMRALEASSRTVATGNSLIALAGKLGVDLGKASPSINVAEMRNQVINRYPLFGIVIDGRGAWHSHAAKLQDYVNLIDSLAISAAEKGIDEAVKAILEA